MMGLSVTLHIFVISFHTYDLDALRSSDGCITVGTQETDFMAVQSVDYTHNHYLGTSLGSNLLY